MKGHLKLNNMNTSKNVPGGIFQPQTLEVDERIFDKNLRIVEESIGEVSGNPFLNKNVVKESNPLRPEPVLPTISVIPDPGLCVKTKNVQATKFFINVCKVEAIPPAKPITEEALQAIIASDDYNTDYKIPMSLGAPRKELDKSGKDCLASDVAVNSVWYDQTMVDSLTFTTFLVNLAMEGLCDKYGDSCNLDRQNWSILRNKRYMGKLQRHTIQQRANVSKIQELDHSSLTPLKSKTLITPMKETPELLLIKEGFILKAKIQLPKITNTNEVSLELGVDRLVLQSAYYSLDIFLPFDVNPEECNSTFHRDTHELTIPMKIKQ